LKLYSRPTPLIKGNPSVLTVIVPSLDPLLSPPPPLLVWVDSGCREMGNHHNLFSINFQRVGGGFYNRLKMDLCAERVRFMLQAKRD